MTWIVATPAQTSISRIVYCEKRRSTVEDGAPIEIQNYTQFARIENSTIAVSSNTPWLTQILERIENATAKIGESFGANGKLNVPCGALAIRFFRNASDLLPHEPFLYPSKSGDLVAEFNTCGGRLTAVISARHAIIFAVKDMVIFEDKVSPESNHFRDDISKVQSFLGG